jgi:nucleolar complex protein 2
MPQTHSFNEKNITEALFFPFTTSAIFAQNRHKGELQGLEKQDPEFFKYLQQNDANLLHFGEGDDSDEDLEGELEEDLDDMESEEEEVEEEEEEEEEVSGEILGRKEKVTAIVEVTEKLLNETIEKAQEGSYIALKKLLSIFRAACLPSNNDADEEGAVDQSSSTFIIPSPEIYQLVMVGVTDNAHVAMYKQLDLDELSMENLAKMDKHPHWKRVQFLVLSYYKSMLHTLASLAVASKQEQVSVFLITSLEAYLPLLSPMPRLAKAVLKSLLILWSQGLPPAEDETDVRVHAFLRIRQMALMLPGTVREECFRSIYLRYARGCKTFSETGGSSVIFMAQCVAELFTSDPVQAYQQAFLYIRQLALHLRAALVKKTSEEVRQVTTWQFLNCLRLWTRVICAMPEADALGPLIFPLAQIMFGVMAAAPSIYFIPLRFHLITCLHQLASSGRVFIPTAARLGESTIRN